jgi:hypothetical protein
MSPGESRAVADLTSSHQIDVTVRHTPEDIDIVTFGLNAEHKIADLANITDEELYDRPPSEFPFWLKAIRANCILPAR